MFAHKDLATRLANLRSAGFQPTGLVDGGAYQGDWTRQFWNIWPGRPSLLIEPLPAQRQILETLAATTPGSKVISKAIGRSTCEVRFRLEETNSGIAAPDSSNHTITIPCTTLDVILSESSSANPNLMKLDLQGFELEALAGCERHFLQFEIIILEVSTLRIGDVPIFSEVDKFMVGHGYRVYDLLPQYYRPRDGALWQMDVFYVREDSLLIASRSWD